MGGAWFSDDERYRYALLRTIDHGLLAPPLSEHCVNFIMLNPSTATADVNDPTITRCANYARQWGYGALMVTNLFAYRATDPKAMKAVTDPIGPENDEYIRKIAENSYLIVVAWGSHGEYRRRDEQVRRILRDIGKEPHCLTTTMKGQPGHPLYLAANLTPQPYRRPELADRHPRPPARAVASPGGVGPG